MHPLLLMMRWTFALKRRRVRPCARSSHRNHLIRRAVPQAILYLGATGLVETLQVKVKADQSEVHFLEVGGKLSPVIRSHRSTKQQRQDPCPRKAEESVVHCLEIDGSQVHVIHPLRSARHQLQDLCTDDRSDL